MTAQQTALPPEAGEPVLETPVLAEWLDHNGHMNVAGYLVAFDRACCALCTRAGIGPDRIASGGHTIFVGQANIAYRREVHADDRLLIAARVREMSQDRLILHMSLFRQAAGEAPELAAVCEELAVCVAMATRRRAPFPPEVRYWFAALHAAEAGLPIPRIVPGAIGLTAVGSTAGETPK